MSRFLRSSKDQDPNSPKSAPASEEASGGTPTEKDTPKRSTWFGQKKNLFSRANAYNVEDQTNQTESQPTPSSSESTTTQSSKDSNEYEQYLEMSKKQDFTELAKLNFITREGVDTAGRPIVMVVGAHLPVKDVNLDHLLLYVISVMDSIVNSDYALIFVQSGQSAANRPSFSWLRKCYRILNRKYKKNLKALYIIHPGFWVKTMSKLFKPFISQKFWQKLKYIEDISDIYKFINRDQLKLPEVVHKHTSSKQKVDPIFAVPLEEILSRPDHAKREIPIVVELCGKWFLEHNGNQVPGLFRLSGSSSEVSKIRKGFDKGEITSLDFVTDAHVIAQVLKLFVSLRKTPSHHSFLNFSELREMPEPVFPFDFFDPLVNAYQDKDDPVGKICGVFKDLPQPNKSLLRFLLGLLSFIEANSQVNKMNCANLAIVFAPNLIRSAKETLQQSVVNAPLVNSIMRLILENSSVMLPHLETSASTPMTFPMRRSSEISSSNDEQKAQESTTAIAEQASTEAEPQAAASTEQGETATTEQSTTETKD